MVVKWEYPADTSSNKPEDIYVKLSAEAYTYLRPTTFKVSVLKPKVDRLTITFAVPSLSDQACIRENLQQFSEDSSNPNVSIWQKQKSWGAVKYALSYAINVGENNRILMQCTAGTAQTAFLRFELNPDRIGPSGVTQFYDLLPAITANKVNHQAFANSGKVTRVDIAVDLVNIDLEDLLVCASKPGVSNSYFGLGGKAETMYLNVNKSGSNLYVYDRREGNVPPPVEIGSAGIAC